MSAGQEIELVVPDLGGFNEVAVIDVLVKVGDSIELEQPLVTLETDKATMDMPSTAAGTLTALRVAKGDKVSQGSVIGVLRSTAAVATVARLRLRLCPPRLRPRHLRPQHLRRHRCRRSPRRRPATTAP
jgi:pyruvate/2-oxoglutarate dehydrogenase complex dihydrolipoamide acyltransferase (E2) component